MTGAGIVVVLAGLLVVWLAIRSRQGRLSRNYVAGVRTRSTMRSDEAFRIANKAAAPFTLVSGLLFVVTGVVAAIVPVRTATVVLLTGVVIAGVVIVVGSVTGVRAAQKVP